MTTIKRALALNEFRMEWLARYWGSPTGKTEDVPARFADDYQAHVEYHAQSRAKIVDSVCAEYGSTTGFSGVPTADKVRCELRLYEVTRRFENRCAYELALLIIDDEESPRDFSDNDSEEAVAPLDFG